MNATSATKSLELSNVTIPAPIVSRPPLRRVVRAVKERVLEGAARKVAHSVHKHVAALPQRVQPAIARRLAEFGILEPRSSDLTNLVQAAYHIHRAQRIVLTTHVNPDADGLASMLALGRALEMMGKNVELIVDGRIPERYLSLIHI